MSTKVLITPRAEQQQAKLRKKDKSTLADFYDSLKANGCGALGYRLTGPTPIDSICVRHLGGRLRVVVAFTDHRTAWILLIGPHDDHDPGIDVYTELYQLVGHKPSTPEKRTKPPCCGEDSTPPVDADLVQELADRAVAVRRTRK